MWADWNTKFGSHEKNCQNLVYSSDTAGIDLADANGIGLEELLENNTILHMLASSNADWCNGPCYCSMAKNIIRASWFFNPEGVKFRQLLHGSDSFFHLPHLVCIEHQYVLRSDLFAHYTSTTQIILWTQPNFQFEVLPAVSQRFAAE